jgi:hypothetical protein
MTVSRRKTVVISAFLVILGVASCLHAQGGDPREILVRKLNDQFVLTHMTADGTDVVKAGSPVTLHRDGLQMCGTDAKIPLTNVYKDGKLSAGKFAWAMAMGLAQPSLPTANVPMRTFVSDEKFWITAISVEKSAVVFKVYSDAYGDVRYYAQLAFPFDKKAPPLAEDLLRTISAVVSAEPASQETAGGPAPASVDQPAPAQQAIAAPPPPPPPPTDAPPPVPPTVSLGQTMDQVTAVMGQPRSVAKAGTKTIFSYPGLKVIFVNGKVSDVQ